MNVFGKFFKAKLPDLVPEKNKKNMHVSVQVYQRDGTPVNSYEINMFDRGQRIKLARTGWWAACTGHVVITIPMSGGEYHKELANDGPHNTEEEQHGSGEQRGGSGDSDHGRGERVRHDDVHVLRPDPVGRPGRRGRRGQ